MNPTTSTNYVTCEPFLLPTPPTDPEVAYVPKVIVCDNPTDSLLSPENVYDIINLTVSNNAYYQRRYQCLTERQVKLVRQQLPMAQIENFLNPADVTNGGVGVIFRNHCFDSISLFSLLPRVNRPMAEAPSPKSNDGAEASASADTSTAPSTSASAVASTLASASTSVQKQDDPKTNLTAHQQHGAKPTNSDKPYVCDMCNKGLCSNNSLINHKQVMHGIGNKRTIKCNECEKRFVEESGLRRHMNKHSAVPNFVCPVTGCDRKLRYQSSLKCHLAKFHPDFNK